MHTRAQEPAGEAALHAFDPKARNRTEGLEKIKIAPPPLGARPRRHTTGERVPHHTSSIKSIKLAKQTNNREGGGPRAPVRVQGVQRVMRLERMAELKRRREEDGAG